MAFLQAVARSLGVGIPEVDVTRTDSGLSLLKY